MRFSVQGLETVFWLPILFGENPETVSQPGDGKWGVS